MDDQRPHCNVTTDHPVPQQPEAGCPEQVAGTVASQPEPKLARTVSNTSRKSVLLLEDDAALLRLLQRHLESLDLDTVTATTVREARQKLAEHHFHLAVFDIQLPDGSGLELCAEIDENPRLTGLPVVILSSSSDPNMVRHTRAAGGCFFISKPYDPNVLLAVIERILGESL